MGGVNVEGAANAAPSATKESGLDLIALTKVFPGGTVAVEDVDLHVDHGEYVVLLGPSGCGKTTTLRMIGGHEFPTEGDIVLDGQSLVGMAPHKRPTTTVFQHFALFPHRNVLDNVEFGLKMHGVPKDARRKQALDALAAGVRFHHATDEAFHGADSFLEFSRLASRFLLDRGLSRGSARVEIVGGSRSCRSR